MQDRRQLHGDREAIVRELFDVRRFTREEHERGNSTGWRFEAGWFERASGLTWAWFSREVQRGETTEIE